jgi:hypothetical protein
MKLSNQAIGAIMMALQKGIMEQVDITETLQEFVLVDGDDGLVVENPPVVNFEEPIEQTQEQP